MEKTRIRNEKEKTMTLFKQMAIAISIMIIILLAFVIAINYQASKRDMIENLYETTVNNISTLSTKLAESAHDNALLVSTIDSEFDSGYYMMIDYKSNDGKNDYLQEDKDPVKGVPSWFIKFSNVQLNSVSADVLSGWDMMGVVTVSGDTGVVYKSLYKMFLNMSYLFVCSVLIFLMVLNILLRFVLKPLKDIEVLSKNISLGKFETITNLPSTLELKNVSISMNDMSLKIKNMISSLNNNLEKMTAELSRDDLTGLEQEQTFNTDMKMMFIKKQEAYVVSVKISNFGEIAKNNTNKYVNRFLKEFANVLNENSENGTAYRFYGSVFAMIIKTSDHDALTATIETLKESLIELGDEYGISKIANIGVTPFNLISTTESILEFANIAYNKSLEIGVNEFYIRDKNDLAADMLVWKKQICNIIDNSTFNVSYNNQVLSMDGEQKLLIEEAFTSSTDDNNKTIAIGTFISVAERYNKIVDFDKAVVKQVIKSIKESSKVNGVMINIAPDSLVDTHFKEWVEEILIENKEIASQLIFSMTAYGCVKNIDAFKEFITTLHKHGAKIILKRFETKFISLDSLKEFNLDYIKLAKEHTLDITTDKSKQSFIESICELSKLLNIKVFTENVNDEEEFEKLKELGVHGASIKDILKYDGVVTQAIVTYCMDQIEDSIVNMSIMTKVNTIVVEILQNMINYGKDLDTDELNSQGSIEVIKDQDLIFYIQSSNILNTQDKEKIEPKLQELQSLDSAAIRKRYRELRKSGENTHDKGGGIGFYEIAKISSKLEYSFEKLNADKYNFTLKVRVESKKKKSA